MTTDRNNCITEVADEIRRLAQARLHDAHAVLGAHALNRQTTCYRAWFPQADEVWLVPEPDAPPEPMDTTDTPGLFVWKGASRKLAEHPELRWRPSGHKEIVSVIDPWSFAPNIPDFDRHLFGEGRHWHAHRMFGAHCENRDGIDGVRFAVWAPAAERVSVVGDFNHWDGRCHPMTVHGSSGIWELFIPGLGPETLYKYEIRNRDTGELRLKSDPYAAAYQVRPETASRVIPESGYAWNDREWMENRDPEAWKHRPMSIYEVHLGSWQRSPDGDWPNYAELAERLVPYARDMGFTHLELLPVTEHPFDGSWGYQSTGFFAPTSRFGDPDDFRRFVDTAHQAGLGVILDWVPGHFPRDDFALARFDGTALYEHEDPRLGEHREWGTLIFNYGRPEVRNFLLSSALCWIEDFHLDGLRVDAVASMLYLDYNREDHEWIPNIHGGNENLDAIEFLRDVNETVQTGHPGVVMIAEESTAWPGVSRPPSMGGLGFTMKWNMGWMHDTLTYFGMDPIYRRYHHSQLTFAQIYAYSENFLLPFSHDEVVHGKRSLRGRMPGNEWEQHANMRLLYAWQWLYPGKKLLFMGQEFGQGTEWSEAGELDWYVLQYPLHQGLQQLVKDLNGVYREQPALHGREFEPDGFAWLNADDADNSVLSFVRRDVEGHERIVILNLTPVERSAYPIPSPRSGTWRVLLNTDSEFYGGASRGPLQCEATTEAYHGQPATLHVDLPPLTALLLEPTGG
ncbi:1,4-alpha-glucan branching enzyme [Thioalkalivibrio sp. ALE21]|uniref:1,4-alpha-glucan branching protein GlgB n=1 Tax=Thioalkalivibrio sp. ALE21 TaxID=1158175 RepID=UPI000D86EA7F|nr:1,4-alpha-glucan branching protein GlgB [Thioalkalivibrio sp. ALE21]PYG02765.1 1,4-alpha-glucan branching enzyme [Thioalkalivibrio sp. ALE21]